MVMDAAGMAPIGPALPEGLSARTQETVGDFASRLFRPPVRCQQVLAEPLYVHAVQVAEGAHNTPIPGCHGA